MITDSTPEAAAPIKTSSPVGRVILIAGVALIGMLFISSLFQTGLVPTGTDAPPFTLQRANAPFNAVSLEEYKGQVVILDFWSTSCPPCLREIEILKRLQSTYADRNLRVVGVSVGGESVAEIADFAKERQVSYPMLVDTTGVTSQAYKVSVLPTMYILDTEGRIAAAHTGFWPADDLEATINDQLNGE